jgi:hypothetical protein
MDIITPVPSASKGEETSRKRKRRAVLCRLRFRLVFAPLADLRRRWYKT